MSKRKNTAGKPVEMLVANIQARLESMLVKWRMVCDSDEAMSNRSAFTREEFNDQVPVLLEILLARMQGKQVDLDPIAVANEHGLHRWQCGYALPDLIREIEHLFTILLEEIDLYVARQEQMDSATLLMVHEQVFRIYGEVNRGSLQYYYQLNQNEAAERTRTLQSALDQLLDLGKQRGQHLRQSSHDLRASFGIAMTASKLLEYPSSEKERQNLVDMLNRNLNSIRDMLLQLTDYAQIEAGQETVQIQKFDAAELITETIQNALPLAKHLGLELQGEGPDKLEVSGDRLKVHRILVNLLHNALKFTKTGGIYVTWVLDNSSRWILSIQDTGPGFTPNTPAALLAEQLKPVVQTPSTHPGPNLLQQAPPANSDSPENFKESEGLGLFIVKKLCELLRASMDIESTPGKGTLVRIRFAAG